MVRVIALFPMRRQDTIENLPRNPPREEQTAKQKSPQRCGGHRRDGEDSNDPQPDDPDAIPERRVVLNIERDVYLMREGTGRFWQESRSSRIVRQLTISWTCFGKPSENETQRAGGGRNPAVGPNFVARTISVKELVRLPPRGSALILEVRSANRPHAEVRSRR